MTSSVAQARGAAHIDLQACSQTGPTGHIGLTGLTGLTRHNGPGRDAAAFRRQGVLLRRQGGVVMIIALIVLVAMTLGGIALVRSVYTANLIAGNLAFRESAISSGDAGVEAAAAWLLAPVSCPDLGADCPASGYSAMRGEPADGQSWDDYWIVLAAAGKTTTVPVANAGGADAAGNAVSYIIQRLCNSLGNAQNANCSAAPAGTNANGGDDKSNIDPLKTPSRVFYRVTSRISGPRNTVTYTQAILAL